MTAMVHPGRPATDCTAPSPPGTRVQATPHRSAAECPAVTPAPIVRGSAARSAAARRRGTLGSGQRRCAAPSACGRQWPPPAPPHRPPSRHGTSARRRPGAHCRRCGSACTSTQRPRSRLGVRAAGQALETPPRPRRSGRGCRPRATTMPTRAQRLRTSTAGCRACRRSCGRPRRASRWRCRSELGAVEVLQSARSE